MRRVVMQCLNTKTAEKYMSKHYSSKRFLGACIDSGAQRTVCGYKQAKAYCKRANIPFSLRKSNVAFKFGNSINSSLGIMEFRIPLPNNTYLPVFADVVDADIPFLIGLNYFDKEKLLPDNIRNKLIFTELQLELPITRRNGHMFLDWNLKTNSIYQIGIIQEAPSFLSPD